MKNLLEEAVRTASDAEAAEALSESGSFDTTLQIFDSTANDEAALGDAADRAIAPDSEQLELEEEQPQWDALDAEVGLETTNDSINSVTELSALGRPGMPAFVRLSPYVCALLAIVSAVVWQSYLNIVASHDAAALGATLVQSRQELPVVFDTKAPGVERFPFIQSVDQQAAESR